MPNRPTAGGVYIPGGYLNTCNSASVTGSQDPVTGAAYPTGLTAGVVVEVSDAEAAPLSNPRSANNLFGGDYQWVQVDSGATAANVQAGRGAFLKLDATGVAEGVEPESGYSNYVVTDQAGAAADTMFCGVFLNAITPGNWGFIFVGRGRVNVTYKSSVTAGTIGNQVLVASSAAGLFDAATTFTQLTIGQATTAAVANGTSACWIKNTYARV